MEEFQIDEAANFAKIDPGIWASAFIIFYAIWRTAMNLFERVAQPIIRAVEKRAREEGRAEERENLARWKRNQEARGVKFLPDEPQDREAEQPAC